MTSIFLSYARNDDEAFVRRLHADLTSAGFDVWFDRVSMPSRQLTFHQEIRDAIGARDRLLLVVGPGVLTSDYVTQEWRFAYFEAGKCVNPIVRLDGRRDNCDVIDGYELIPEDLKLLHAEDFRDDAQYDAHLANLIRQLSEAIPPVGKLVAVPELPACFLAQPDRIKALRDLLLVDLQKPVVVSGAAARVGLQGMGGIGKSVLASALAHRPEVRRAFPDGIFWITLGQKPELAEQQRWLARELGDEALFPTVESGKECLRSLLAGRKALLVLDDVWQREHAEAFNVIGAMGRILLTTRDAGLVSALASKETHYRVELPTEAEAEGIFAKAAQPKPNEPPIAITADEVREIVAQCGRLPLALALCGGMVQKSVTPQAVLEALRRHALRSISDRWAAEEQHRNIWVAMEASVEMLPAEEQKRFVELAVFPLDRGAPQAAVDALWRHTGGLEPYESQILLAELAERSLVQLTSVTDADGQTGARMTLHDLLHNFAEGMAERQFGSLDALHQTLLDAYWRKCPSGWASGPDDGYFFQNLCEHLLAAGKLDEAVELLTGLPWIEAKCKAKLVFSLQEDYCNTIAQMPKAQEGQESEAEAARREALRLIQGALRLSLHVLVKDPSQLAPQFTGRLLPHRAKPGISGLLREIEASATCPWLRPLWPALDPPGTALLRTLAGHSGWVRAVAVTPDGRRAVSASSDNTLKVWDLETGKGVRTLAGHASSVWGVAVTPDGRCAVSASFDHTLKVWDLETGDEVRTFAGHSWGVRAVAVTPDGRRAVSASDDNTLKVWDLETGGEVCTLVGHSDWVLAAAVTPDGRCAVSASRDNTLKVWDLESGDEVRTLAGHSGPVCCVAVTPDGRRAVSASNDKTLKVWDLETGNEVSTLAGHSNWVWAVAVTPDGRRAVSGADDKTLKVWDLETGNEVRTLAGHSGPVWGVAVTPDGRRAVSASADGTLKVWDLESGKEMRTLAGHSMSVNGAAVTPDGRRAVSGSSDNTLKVWDLETGKELRTLAGHSGWVRAVAVTPDGRRAVSASSDNTLKVWDLETGNELHALAGHSDTVYGVAVTPDGRRAVSGSGDKTLKVWDLETGQEVRTLVGHSDTVYGVAVTRGGRRAVSASVDGTLKVWDLVNGATVATFTCDAGVTCCACADDRHFVAGDAAGRVHLLSLEPPQQR